MIRVFQFFYPEAITHVHVIGALRYAPLCAPLAPLVAPLACHVHASSLD